MKEKLKIVYVPVEQLNPAEYNPRKLTQHEARQIQESIDEFGMVEPIVVNGNEARKNIIIGGHQRYNLCKARGMTEIPVVYVDIVDIKKEQELNLRLNKAGGSWDWDKIFNIDEEILMTSGFTHRELESHYRFEREKPDVEFTEELYEAHNYVVLYFDNEVDWLQLQTLYPLQSVKALDSKDKYEKKGIGRVVKGSDFLDHVLGRK